jgi:hypothetical protein
VSLRYLVVELIKKIAKGTIIKTQSIQSAIYKQFPDECEKLGFTPSATEPVEEKWKKDIRFALRDAQDQRLIVHIGSPRSGLWERL